MKCIVCGEQTSLDHVSVNVNWKGKAPIKISGVPAHVCPCGEVYYDADSVELLQAVGRGYAERPQGMPDLLNVKEVAGLLSVSAQSVYNMLSDGRLRASKVGREWRFNVEDIRRIATGGQSNRQNSHSA